MNPGVFPSGNPNGRGKFTNTKTQSGHECLEAPEDLLVVLEQHSTLGTVQHCWDNTELLQTQAQPMLTMLRTDGLQLKNPQYFR